MFIAETKRVFAASQPHKMLVYLIAINLFISGSGTWSFWLMRTYGMDVCVDCVPFGLSLYRFLYWPMNDFVLGLACFATSYTLVKRVRPAVFYCGLFMAGEFLVMSLSSLATRLRTGAPVQPFFLDVYFLAWGSFLAHVFLHWEDYWKNANARSPNYASASL